jgi:hypothetical protein
MRRAHAILLALLTVVASFGLAVPAQATSYPAYTWTRVHDGDTVAGPSVAVALTAYLDPAGTAQWNQGAIWIDGVAASPVEGCFITAPVGTTCLISTSWDTTGLTGTHAIHAVLQYRDGNTTTDVTTPDITVTVSPNLPTVAITGPADGATVTGKSPDITVHAVIPAELTAYADYVQLRANGLLSSSQSCTGQANDHVCDLSFPLDVSGDTNGTMTLQPQIFDSLGQSFLGATITVTIDNPAITGSITSPADGSTATGTETLTAEATIPAVLSQTAQFVSWDLDGWTYLGDTPCTGADNHHCQASLPWSTTGVAPGVHTVYASFRYDNGTLALTPVHVIVETGSHLAITVPASAKPGTTITGHAKLSTTIGGWNLPGAPVTVTINPAIGASRVLHLTTDAMSTVAFSYVAGSNTTVTATAASGAYWTGTSATARTLAATVLKCTWSTVIVHGHRATGRCTGPSLPAGLPYQLQVKTGTTWKTVVRGKSIRGAIAVSLLESRKATVYLRVVLPASRYWTSTTGPTMKVVVR